MRRIRLWQIMGFGVFALAVSAAPAAEHTKDSLDEVRKAVADDKAVLVDVRELREWNAGHVSGAQFVPLSTLGKKSNDPQFKEDLAQRLGKEQRKIVYCHCKAGGRCLMAVDVLTKLGYDARALKPGYDDLLKAGFKKAEDEPQSGEAKKPAP